MAAKETIALIGIAYESCAGIIEKLAQSYRLLLVTTKETNFSGFSEQIISNVSNAEIEDVECAKDGCWEADIIALRGACNFEQGFINNIKAVATQKIVVAISPLTHLAPPDTCEANNLKHLLPYSKVVQVFNKTGSLEAFVAGDDNKAVHKIAQIIKVLGFQVRQVESLSDIPEEE